MLNHMNSMTDINSFLISRIQASSKYISSRLADPYCAGDFHFAINRIIDVVKSNNSLQESLYSLKKDIRRLEYQFILSRPSHKEWFFNPSQKKNYYEDYAFAITYDILNKTEQRFITGYSCYNYEPYMWFL